MGIQCFEIIVTLLLTMILLEIDAVSNGGTCTSNDDCDANTGLKCYMYNDGVTNCPTGTCGCGENRVWLTSYCGKPIGAIGDKCSTANQCSTATTNSECTNHVCRCSTGYYRAGSYLCLQGPGTVALNSVCTNSNHCVRDLICTRCPGVSSGDMHCRSQSGAVNIKPAWILVLAILGITMLIGRS